MVTLNRTRISTVSGATKGLSSMWRIALSVVLTAFVFNVTSPKAQAQQTPYYDLSTSEISVDLSVLNDGGLGMPRTGAVSPSVGGGSLLMPGGRPPQSRLLVSPPRKPASRPKLRRPAKRKAATRTRTKPRVKARPPKATAKVTAKPKQPKKPTPVAPKVAAKKTTASAPPPPPPIAAAPKTAAKVPPLPVPTPTAITPKAAPVAPVKQQAAVKPTAPVKKTKSSDQSVLVTFSDKSAKVSAAMKPKLKKLAGAIKGKSDMRLQLMAYAGGPGISPSKARRLSLSRALAVRSYLISTGVRSTRIDVRALGNKTTKKPINRVDVSIVKR